eukprot:5192126-Lingulodinium_polyedra.AAC.1
MDRAGSTSSPPPEPCTATGTFGSAGERISRTTPFSQRGPPEAEGPEVLRALLLLSRDYPARPLRTCAARSEMPRSCY